MKKGFLFFCIIIMITAWYSCTKDTAPRTATTCDSTKISFDRDIKPIFVANCATAGCHDATTKQNGYDYAQYVDSKTSMQNSGSSGLVCRLQGTCGARMPSGGYPLADSLINKVIQWQADGFCN